MSLPRSLSSSAVRCYLTCGERYRRQYVLRAPTRTPMAFARGGALDEAANYHYRHLAQDKPGCTREEFLDLVEAAHVGKCEEPSVQQDMAPAVSLGQTLRAAGAYYDAFASRLQPRSFRDVQAMLTQTVPGLDVPILGVVDLITAEGLVVDTKFADRLPPQEDVDRSLQLTTYSILTGLADVALAVATSRGQAQLIRSSRTQADLDSTVELYARVWEGIKASVYVPCEPTNWSCSERWCGFHASCRWGGLR